MISFHIHFPMSPNPEPLTLSLPLLTAGSIGGDNKVRNTEGGGGGGRDGGRDEGELSKNNREEALLVLAELGWPLDSLPADLATVVEAGHIPTPIVQRFATLEKSPFFCWLLQFGGFKECLLADDLFLASITMECAVGIFTKTTAEWEHRRENFVKELDFVLANVVMAIVASFMFVWLPAPTVSLRPALEYSVIPHRAFSPANTCGLPFHRLRLQLAWT